LAHSGFTLKQLEALVWVADLGSFRKAAAHLNTTQPNISARIAALETVLGVVLMRRDAGAVTMTDRGSELLVHARAVLQQSDKLIEAAGRTDLITQRMRLGVTELIAQTWLHAYLRALQGAYPNLIVEVTVDLARNLDRDLAANGLDLAIQNAPFHASSTGHVGLGAVPYCWTAAPNVLGNIEDISLVSIWNLSILTHARHTDAFQELTEHAETLGLGIGQIIPSNSMATCVQRAIDGAGVALLPKALVQTPLEQGTLTALSIRWVPSPLRFAARYHARRAARHVKRAAELAQKFSTTA
jgi:DNA-binding transcriptional LysR family regulator